MKTPAYVRLLLVAAIPAALASAALRQTADLKTFFHGEPVAPPKAPPPKVTAGVSTAEGVAPDQQVEGFFRAFAAAVKTREGAPMRARLSEKFTMADAPEGHPPADFFIMGIERMAGPEAIVIQSVETKGTVRTVKAEIRYEAKTTVKTFRFDAEGKLLASDLFTLKRVEHGA